MRIWHYELLPYLPDAQFKGQLRELVAIMHDWRDKGKTNHILINKVMEYPKAHLHRYFILYSNINWQRYGKTINPEITDSFFEFLSGNLINIPLFEDWHNKEYLRICMANLYEKHLGVGKSQITNEEWERLCIGYKNITGEDYEI